MSDSQLVAVLWRLAPLLAAGRVLARLSVRLRQPELAGEIAAGAVLGPLLFAAASPGIEPSSGPGDRDETALLLDVLSRLVAHT